MTSPRRHKGHGEGKESRMTDNIVDLDYHESEDLPEWRSKVDAAHAMVSALCKPRGTEGAREWLMRIPADPENDPDLVITAGLHAAERRIEELERGHGVVLAKKHTGMRVSICGLLRHRDAYALGELQGHLEELARRFYAGDVAAVDEFLQLYCLDGDRPKEEGAG